MNNLSFDFRGRTAVVTGADAVIATHLTGTLHGRIINVTSYSGLHGNTGQANYSAAKAGVIGFTKTTAKELARFGVTVNAISPQAETRMIASIPEDKRAEVEAAIPMGRFAAASEMTAAVQFLASAEAGYITGIVLPVDGGVSV
jgi:3-oxoacyl-[acyl-carrier protein] reductase